MACDYPRVALRNPTARRFRMERDPETRLDDEEDVDLFGDPDEVEVSIEDELDERLEIERDDEI
jgi:hypothetical protein